MRRTPTVRHPNPEWSHHSPDGDADAAHLVAVLGARDVLRVNGSRHARVARIAELQRGRVSRRQLRAAGISDSGIDRMLATCYLHAIHRGVYAVGHPGPVTLGRETAALLTRPFAAVLSHHSAAAIWGLCPADDNAPVELTVCGGGVRPREGILVHRTRHLHPSDVSVYRGLPITSPARTLADIADLVSPRELERALDEALIRRIVTLTQLREVADRARGRGGRLLRSLIDARSHSTITRSQAEERFLALIRAAKLPQPEVNVRLHGFTVDFFWREEGVVVEVDGYRFHSTRSAFERDHRKDAALRAAALEVIRFTWSQLAEEPYAVVALVGQALARR